MSSFTSPTVRRVTPPHVDFKYYSFRNISAPEDTDNDRKVFAGNAPAQSFFNLPTHKNVRQYLVDAEGKKRRARTAVHRAIYDTLKTRPEDFSILNGGIVITAEHYEVDEQKKTLRLYNPSIINGSQTQGVLEDFFDECDKNNIDSPLVHVSFEILVASDDELIDEISVARNFQNDVMALSIAGRKQQLNELELSLQKKRPGVRIRKSETDLRDDFVDTEKLIQIITALIPQELWHKPSESDDPNKVYTYSMKTKCLKDFQEIFVKKDSGDVQAQKLYQFFLDICGQALDLYEHWKSHQGFTGTRIRGLTRDEKTQRIVDIPDGIVFPILASLSAFAVKEQGVWQIKAPSALKEDKLIQAAVRAYQEIAKSNFSVMGKTKACYSQIYQITTIYKDLTSD